MPCVQTDIHPFRILDRFGRDRNSLIEILKPEHITAFVGSGGKTSTMLAVGNELCRNGARVIVSTTTHIFPVAEPMPTGMRVAGRPLSDGRLGMPNDLEHLADECDYLLIESDGSRRLPVKAPAEHEPVLISNTELVVAVQGLSALGKTIEKVCHRPEYVCRIINKKQDDLLNAEDYAKLILHENGLRKDVAGRRYAVVLNQADGDVQIDAAAQIISYLPESIACAVTAYDVTGRS